MTVSDTQVVLWIVAFLVAMAVSLLIVGTVAATMVHGWFDQKVPRQNMDNDSDPNYFQ